MADTPLSVLLQHTDGVTPTNYGLKADSFIVQVSKSPIQIPIPQSSPQLIDFGIFRPAITISGIVDDIGGDPSATSTSPDSNGGMESFQALFGASVITFYIPYKNKLEESLYQWMTDDTNSLTLQMGDPTYPVFERNAAGSPLTGNQLATGGSQYRVALQQVRFQVDAGREDRWIFQMQFVAEARLDAKVALLGG